MSNSGVQEKQDKFEVVRYSNNKGRDFGVIMNPGNLFTLGGVRLAVTHCTNKIAKLEYPGVWPNTDLQKAEADIEIALHIEEYAATWKVLKVELLRRKYSKLVLGLRDTWESYSLVDVWQERVFKKDRIQEQHVWDEAFCYIELTAATDPESDE